ncbi:ABC transporter substrate-binding protein [Deferribacteres bacterium DY0037]
MSLLIFTLSACNSRHEIPDVRLGNAHHDHHASLYIAAEKGEYFKDIAGVFLSEVVYKSQYKLYRGNYLLANIYIDASTGGIHLVRKLNDKILDVAFGGVPAMISMIDEGSDIKIISPVMSEGAALVVRNDIPASNWDEFIDYIKTTDETVRIGYKIDVSVQNLIFESALHYEGIIFGKDISTSDVDVVVVNLHGPENLLPSLQAGVIDGFVVMQPYPALSEYSGSAKIISYLSSLPPPEKWNEHPCCALASRGDFLEEHSDVADALVTLFGYASDYIRQHPEESVDITSRWLSTPHEVEMKSLPSIIFMNEYTDSWNKGVNFWVQSLIDKGMLHGKVKEAYDKGTIDRVLYNNNSYEKMREHIADNVNQ